MALNKKIVGKKGKYALKTNKGAIFTKWQKAKKRFYEVKAEWTVDMDKKQWTSPLGKWSGQKCGHTTPIGGGVHLSTCPIFYVAIRLVCPLGLLIKKSGSHYVFCGGI
jgi:hypothetical protein